MTEPSITAGSAARRSWAGWLAEGARTAFFAAPRWPGLRPGAALMAVFYCAGLLLAVLAEREMVGEPAAFYWQALAANWFGTAMLAWACYAVRPQGGAVADRPHLAPGAAQLFTLGMAQALVQALFIDVYFAVLLHSGAYDRLGYYGQWAVAVLPVAWVTLAQLTLLRRCGERRPWPTLAAWAAMVAVALAYFLAPPAHYWKTDEAADSGEPAATIQLSQEVFEAQAPLLEQQLQALKPQRRGVIDLYTITFAPYASEEVFRRESRMVAQVMAQRFDAEGRGLQLMNHAQTAAETPWATPLNLQRAIQGIAAVMDRDEDVLFIHLTSHGAADGQLAAYFWPMEVDPVLPEDLKAWLDEAGIKHRVISISACYAGNWIAPLAGDDTLVMTASDADHTSYGCGSKSDLTFFGRAMYDEQLRTNTLSFEEAHAAARKVILQRENEARKTDGYSNPQIKTGSAIHPYLLRLQQRLQGK